MSLGNFKETNESNNEVNDVDESVDNVEKSSNEIHETADAYEDDFDKKLDAIDNLEASNEKQNEKFMDKGEGEKTSFLDKMRNLFTHKEKDLDTENDVGKESQEVKEEQPQKSAHQKFAEQFQNWPGMEEARAEARSKRMENTDSNTDTDDNHDDILHGEDGGRTLWSDEDLER